MLRRGHLLITRAHLSPVVGVMGLLAIGLLPSVAEESNEERSTSDRGAAEQVPPLPPLDAPKRPFREALLHLTRLEADYFEEQLERLEAGTYDLGVYNEMYEFFRAEHHRLSDEYPGEKFTFDGPELSEASDRLTRARQTFQTRRFIAEQLENREKLGLDNPERAEMSFEERALPLIQEYTRHYREAADQVRRANVKKLEDVDKGIRAEGLRMNRDLRRLSANFPDQPSIFGGEFAEEPLKSARRELDEALEEFQAIRKQRSSESADGTTGS